MPDQNVIFVICDDLNNALPGMGRRPLAAAPHLESLMRNGVRFTQAYNNSPICLPSRNSLLSGLYPHTTGQYTLWDNWTSQRAIATTGGGENRYRGAALLPDAVMLPQHFRNHGYETYGVGKVHHEGLTDPRWWTEYAYGPDYGPLLWDDERGRPRAHPDREWLYEGEPLRSYARRYAGLDRFFLDGQNFRHHIEMSFGSMPEILGVPGVELRTGGGQPYHYADDEDRDPLPDELTADWAVDVLHRKHTRPFFLAVGFMKPHTPLNVPQRFFDLFPPEQLELPPFLEGDCEDCARALVEHRPYGFLTYAMILKGGHVLWRKWLQAYLACIAFIDEQLGKILAALADSPYRENTILVFTSDNGYHMGEKAYIFKDTLWEEAGQVPLVICAPGLAHPGSACLKPVSLIDLYPTLTELCGLPGDPHAATHGHPLQGRSLLPLLDDPEQGVWPGIALTSVRGDTGIHHSVRSERYRYILCQNGEDELYDHASDPYEWRNLVYDMGYSGEKIELRQRMMEILWK